MRDYRQEELGIMKSYKHSDEGSGDYTPEELAMLKQHEDHSLSGGLTRAKEDWKKFPDYALGLLAGSLKDLQGFDIYKNKLLGGIGLGNPQKAQNQKSDYEALINQVLPQSRQSKQGQRGMAVGEVAAPFLIPGGPEIEGAGKAGAGFLGVLPKLSKLAKNVGTNFGINEALAPVFNPDKSLKDAYREGIAPSAIGAVLPGVVATGKNVLGGALRQGGTASSEEFARNLAAAKEAGVNLPIGQAAASPFAKSTQLALAKIPGTGQAPAYVEAGQRMKDATEDVLDSMSSLPDVDSKERTPLQHISDYINRKTMRLKSIDSKNYEAAEKRADEIGETISDRNNIATASLQASKKINKLKITNPNRKFDKTLLNDLKDAETANPLDFSFAGPERKRYDELAQSAFAKGDNFTGSVYKKLMKGHQADVENNLDQIKDEKLAALLKKAKQFHAKAIGPIEDNPNLKKYAFGNGNPDLLGQTFLKGGDIERPLEAKAVMDFLPPKLQKQLVHEMLTKSNREGFQGEQIIREDKALNQFQGLGDRTKQIMFKTMPEKRQKLEAIAKTRKLYGTDLDQLSNPKNGEQSAKQQWLKMALLLGLGGGVGYGVKEGEISPTELLLAGLGLKGASAYTRSPLARHAYRAGLKLKESPTKLRSTAGLQALFNQEGQ